MQPLPAIAPLKTVVPPEEWQVRCDLAAAYRLVALFGWDDLVFTHISARVPGGDHHFLINPYGLFFEEITASSLIKVDLDGRPLMDSPYPVNPAGFVIHSAVHAAREQAGCVLHTHTVAGVAVSAQEAGLLPISQQSGFPLANLAYHAYEGVALRDDEKARLVADLGSASQMILRNHGLLSCGRNVAEAFLAMYTLQRACEIQIAAQAGGGPLTRIPRAIVDDMPRQAVEVSKGLGGQLVWPGLLRRLARHFPGWDA
ncbi:class II aldolase/adducin family protein [Piscinibacter sakaiensis]|uniref:Ribulose-5-phosphate 4-epimerase n=1 Tax=Piscinibacter sakaiensis TaxID=1547922 RepID=A0A0K8NX47_PISS1|nr:class II aldolase/adducin family protein [Piscinibacter sakaiensis]GAP34505.1 ribulose-5-phosphate 4-epimerase [Piscinibacter sakaiensis]